MNREKLRLPAKRSVAPFASPWPTIWIWFFLAITSLGILAPGSLTLTIIKLSSILACLVYSLKVFPRDHLLNLALLLTFLADILLAIGTSRSEPLIILGILDIMELGVLVFFSAQICHLFRLTKTTSKSSQKKLTNSLIGKLKSRPLILGFLIIMISATVFNLIFVLVPPMVEICVFYAIAISANIFVSLIWVKNQPGNLTAKFALIGFILFLSCDICTGISYLATNSTFPAFLVGPANFFAWFFYYPSQIFISNSSKYVKIEPKQEIVL